MSVLDDLGVYLQGEGIGIVNTSIFHGGLPFSTPQYPVLDAIIALIPVPGLSSLHTLSPGSPVKIEQPVVQILTRGKPHEGQEAFTRAMAAYEALDGLNNTTINNVFYLTIFAMQPPFLLRQADEMGRPHIAFNIRCQYA
jgi:hypothetical protein